MIRRPPRSTLDRSSAASDVYKRQVVPYAPDGGADPRHGLALAALQAGTAERWHLRVLQRSAVSYTHLRAHETVLDLVCRLLLEKKKESRTHIFDP